MKDDQKESKDLDLSKVLATALAYTKKTLKKTKEELVEGVKEILDPVTGEKVRVLEIKGTEGSKGEKVKRESKERLVPLVNEGKTGELGLKVFKDLRESREKLDPRDPREKRAILVMMLK